ncbi:hypothetical protein NVP1024O_81 [Vibrio phage 1.024.O._10N.261.45.F8]|nr:hypothetical protein NVP1024O_81 [Vibrio phage 1.024.O._10N.261.45.F8]
MKYDPNLILQRNIKNLFNVNGTLEDEQMFELISRVKSDAHAAQSQVSVVTKLLVEADLMKLNISSSVKSLIEIATAPDATQPQLSEIRYVLHGDIQPCSVLYSDDTTTLLRLDEGDIMCETDTIEWSDSVTYRCQELLKGESKRSNIPVTLSPVKLLAQLVRDERILLNDNGDDDLGADEAYFREDPVVQATAALPWQCLECRNAVAPDLSMCPTCHTKVPRTEER